MNVNERLTQLEDVTGYPVRPDVYSGKADKYIVFTYEDERTALYADNEEQSETAWIQVKLYTPEDYNYMKDKKLIKNTLKELGFEVESVASWMTDEKVGTKKTRQTIFQVNITLGLEE